MGCSLCWRWCGCIFARLTAGCSGSAVHGVDGFGGLVTGVAFLRVLGAPVTARCVFSRFTAGAIGWHAILGATVQSLACVSLSGVYADVICEIDCWVLRGMQFEMLVQEVLFWLAACGVARLMAGAREHAV